MCCHQDGRLCCSFDFRCGDDGRAVGYDGVVGGTGLPELQDPVLQRVPTIADPVPAAAAIIAGTGSPARSISESSTSLHRRTTTADPVAPPPTSQPTGIISRVSPSNIDNTKQYSEALQVDNSSVIGSPVSTKKVLFVSDSENHDVDNKTETDKGSSTTGASQEPESGPGPG